MEGGAQLAIPWQGLVTADGQLHKRGNHPLLDKIFSDTVSYLGDPVAVCSRIRSHSGYATLPGYYNILYQSFLPNCKLSIEVLKRYYRVPRHLASFILGGRNIRVCNQRLMTFILVEFEKEYDILRLCLVIEQLIQLPELRKIADKLRNAFPIKPKENIQPIVVDSEDTSEVENEVEFGAECLQSGSIEDTEEMVDATVKELRASGAQALLIQKIRNRSSSISHYPLESQVTNHVPEFHETGAGTDDGLQSTAKSWFSAVNPPSLGTTAMDDSQYTLDAFTQDTGHFSDSMLSNQLSEEVKLKPTKPIEFLRSHSSEVSSPAKSLSSLSPNKDHHHSLSPPHGDSPYPHGDSMYPHGDSLYPHGDSLYPASPLSDRPLLESATPAAAVNKEMTVTLQPSMSSTASVSPFAAATAPTAAATAASITDTSMTLAALLESKGFEPLKSRYSSLYQSFPKDYMETVSKLERHLTDTDIVDIISSPSETFANKMILDSLIMQMKCKEDLLDLCDQLEKISISPDMNRIIHDLRNDVVKKIQKETAVVHSSSDHSERENELDTKVFSEVTAIDPNSKVMEILRRYYSVLCHSITLDYMTCVAVVSRSGMIDQSFVNKLKTSDSPIKAKQLVVDTIIKRIDCEERMLDFCDCIDGMVQDSEMKHTIESFRNEILAVLSSKPLGSTEWRYPKKRKVMLVQARAGGHTNQLSEEFMGTSAAEFMGTSAAEFMGTSATADTISVGDISEPPSIPQYYVRRSVLEKQLTDAVLTNDQGGAAVTVTITGDSGFGKSVLAKAFCHSEDAKQYFTSGFILIELGSSVPNPLSKLRRLYRLLSHGAQISGDINSIVQYLHSLIVQSYPRILVIIDDVCNAHDAQPYITAFRSCKIIVTTKLGNISKQLSSCSVVNVESMEVAEATKLLTNIPVQITEDDEEIVHGLVTDLHLWPLLICLARGQFQVNQSTIQTIGDLQSELYAKGLEQIAYTVDKNVAQGRRVAVTACIESSLQLLEVNEHDCLISLVHQGGVGAVVSFRHVLHYWNLPEEECVQLLTKLDSMSLVVFTHAAAGNTRATVKVNFVISQYLMDTQVYNPPAHLKDSQDGLLSSEEQTQHMTVLLFSRETGAHETRARETGSCSYCIASARMSETPEVCLTGTLHNITKHSLPCFFTNSVLSRIVWWATHIVHLVHNLASVIYHSPDRFPNYVSLASTAEKIEAESQGAMMESKEEIVQLNESVSTFLKERKYDSAKEAIEKYFKRSSIREVGLRAQDLTDQILSQCNRQSKEQISIMSEFLYCFKPEYDFMLNLLLPQILLSVKFHQRITTALESDDPSVVEEIAEEIWVGKHSEQSGLINANYMIKLQEVAPHYVSELAGHDDQEMMHSHSYAYASTEV